MRLHSVMTVTLLLASPVLACAWDYRPSYLRGEASNRLGSHFVFGSPDPKHWELELAARQQALDPGLTPEVEIQTRNDIAVALMHTGKAHEALTILEALEAQEPGKRYQTAANLGTAYELDGQLANAKKWITEAIARNAESHQGTEWVHLAILDAELALADDPRWLETHTVMGLPRGDDELVPFTSVDAEKAFRGKGLRDIENAVEYQLRERVTFVAPPNAVVGDLFHTLAMLAAANGAAAQDVIQVLELAKQYQAPRLDLVETRLAFAQHQANTFVWSPGYVMGAVLAVLFTLLALLLIRERRARKRLEGGSSKLRTHSRA